MKNIDRIGSAICIIAILLVMAITLRDNPSLRWPATQPGHIPKAILRIAAVPPVVLFRSSDNLPDEYPRYVKTQIALLHSRLILTSALQGGALGLHSLQNKGDLADWLRDRVEAKRLDDSEVLEISLKPGSGLDDQEQAIVINAVVHAYMNEIVNVERKRRTARLDNLKGLLSRKSEGLARARQEIRTVSSVVEPDIQTVKEAGPRLYLTIKRRMLELRLEQAEVEAMLKRRQKEGDRITDQSRKQIDQFEDKLVAIGARRIVLEDELKQLVAETRSASARTTGLEALKEELAQPESVSRSLGSEINALEVELQAPPRVTMLERAEASPPESAEKR